MCRRSLLIAALCVALLFGAGCQTFRNSQSEADAAQDKEAAEFIAAIGPCVYFIAQLVSCFR